MARKMSEAEIKIRKANEPIINAMVEIESLTAPYVTEYKGQDITIQERDEVFKKVSEIVEKAKHDLIELGPSRSGVVKEYNEAALERLVSVIKLYNDGDYDNLRKTINSPDSDKYFALNLMGFLYFFSFHTELYFLSDLYLKFEYKAQ